MPAAVAWPGGRPAPQLSSSKRVKAVVTRPRAAASRWCRPTPVRWHRRTRPWPRRHGRREQVDEVEQVLSLAASAGPPASACAPAPPRRRSAIRTAPDLPDHSCLVHGVGVPHGCSPSRRTPRPQRFDNNGNRCTARCRGVAPRGATWVQAVDGRGLGRAASGFGFLAPVEHPLERQLPARRRGRRARCCAGTGGRAGAGAPAGPAPAHGTAQSPRAGRSRTGPPSGVRRARGRRRARARLARPAHLLRLLLPRCPGTWHLLASAIGASVAPGGGAAFSLVERRIGPRILRNFLCRITWL